jgi:hypothetical protein
MTGNYSNITSTTTIFTGACQIYGIWVSSASSTPTLAVGDLATACIAQFTPAAPTWYPMPISLANGLKVTISGTVNCTVVWGT